MMSSAVTSAGASERDIRKCAGLAWIARADMAEGIDHAEFGEDAAADHDVLEQGRRNVRQGLRVKRHGRHPKRQTGNGEEDTDVHAATSHGRITIEDRPDRYRQGSHSFW